MENHPKQKSAVRGGHTRPALIGLATSLFLLILLGVGCRSNTMFPTAAAPAVCPAPDTAMTGGDEREMWRQRYRNNRPAAPERYQVFPKPPRDNSFGEFNDAMHQGLARQPALPPLPADTMPPPASFPPPPGALRSVPAVATTDRTGPAVASSVIPVSGQAPARSMPPSGVSAGGHFYPVEQLVFGGDYPDIDKPELYRLMPKDVITITVKDHPEFSGQLEIQPDGTVRVPNAPDIVRLRGKTVEEAADRLQQTLAVYIRGECRVRVQANRARGGYYFVFGEVLQPGRFPMGMEPLPLSQAILAANWEANPLRRDLDGDELGPSFPAATPRGRYIAPPQADLAGVLLITPHRSQPVRSRHDVRSALLGMTSEDPLIRPGQIIVVPSLDPARNRRLGLGPVTGDAGVQSVPVPAARPGDGFSGANSPARLPAGAGAAEIRAADTPPPPYSAVDANMTAAFDTSFNTEATRLTEGTTVW